VNAYRQTCWRRFLVRRNRLAPLPAERGGGICGLPSEVRGVRGEALAPWGAVIERFYWTDHAGRRAWERKFDRFEVEMTIRLGHDGRIRNDGRADWRVSGECFDGRVFEVVYDHPVEDDAERVRIVSIWEMEDRGLS